MKQKIKIITDVMMTAALLLLMGYQLWGELAHEITGTVMFLLFIAHHFLNISWHKNLFKGKYTAVRTAILAVDILVLLAMLIQMYCGVIISKHIFGFLPINSGMAIARRLHILGAYWGFVLVSIHLGIHWNMVIGRFSEKINKKNSRFNKFILPAAGTATAIYGIIAFVKRNFISYLLLKNEFVFMDFDEPKVLFYIDYLAIMGLFIFISHLMFGVLKNKRSKNNFI